MILVIACAVRLYLMLHLTPFMDELQLATEMRNLTWHSIPAHFKGFGWGENIALALLAWPLHQFLNVHEFIALRGIILCANLLSLALLYVIVKKLWGVGVAIVAGACFALWPWSMLAGSIGFNVFLLPLWALSLLVALHRHAETGHLRYWYTALLCIVLCLYTYAASFLWLPLLALAWRFSFGLPRLRAPHYAGIIIAAIVALPITLFHVQSLLGYQVFDRIGFIVFPELVKTRFENISFVANSAPWEIVTKYLFNYATHFMYVFLSFNPVYIAHGLGAAFTHVGLSFLWDPVFFGNSPTAGLYNNALALPWDPLFILIGIWVAWTQRARPHTRFLLWWLILYPLASSFIHGDYVGFTLTRDMLGMPLLIVLSALGAVRLGHVCAYAVRFRRSRTSI